MQTIELIKQWGHDRGITVNGTHYGQWLKLQSEFGELCDNLAKGKDIRDDIGDMFVVIVMMCEINKVAVEQAVIDAFNLDQGSRYNLVELAFDIWLASDDFSFDDAKELIKQLIAMALLHKTTLTECIEVAYADIKDRKGYLNEHGVFVKEP